MINILFNILFVTRDIINQESLQKSDMDSDDSKLSKSTADLSLKSAENDICPLSQKRLSEIDSNHRLTIWDEKHAITVDSNFIIDFIQSELNRNHSIFEIKLEAFTAQGSAISIVLNDSVWFNCLLRQHKSITL